MNIKPGDIFLHYGGKSLINRLICYGTKSKFHHCSICVSSSLIIEATSGLVRAQAIKNIESFYSVYRVKEEYSYNIKRVIHFLNSKLNANYDYRGVIWLGILKLLRLKQKSNAFQKKKDYFCSELVYEAFSEGGLDIVPGVPSAGITSPADIANSERLCHLGSFEKYITFPGHLKLGKIKKEI